MFVLAVDGDNYGMHMHTYECSAYVNTGRSAHSDVLDYYGVFKACDSLHCKCTARVELWTYPNLCEVIAFHAGAFDYHRTIEMLTTLHSKIELSLFELGEHGVHYMLCDIFA